jgi:hypothetical protein
MAERRVKRVLVMLDYGEGDPQSGEVFDLTELVRETALRCEKGLHVSSITLDVDANSDYDAERGENGWPLKTTVEWRAMINYERSGTSGHLDDAINAAMPDSMATQDIRKKLERVSKRAEKLREDIQVQRLRDAAAIRHQHPIARVSETPIRQIPEVVSST